MKSIKFTATFSDRTEQVEICQPTGGAGSIHLIIDKYFIGQFVNYKGDWIAYLNEKAGIQGDDVSALIDIVREYFPKEVS